MHRSKVILVGSPVMQLLDVPIPALQCIIEHMAMNAGLLKAFRLRLVCSEHLHTPMTSKRQYLVVCVKGYSTSRSFEQFSDLPISIFKKNTDAFG